MATRYTDRKAEIDQFSEGLKSFGVMTLLKKNPSLAMFLLLKRDPTPLSADTLLSLFVPAYSEAGSNARSAQEGIMLNWDDYVREVAEGCMEESYPGKL